MIPKTPLPHIREYVSELNTVLREQGRNVPTDKSGDFLRKKG